MFSPRAGGQGGCLSTSGMGGRAAWAGGVVPCDAAAQARQRPHYVGMPTWVTSTLVSVGVSVATLLVIGLTVGPRLAARSKRVQAAHDSRDRFNDSVLDILALCSNLEAVVSLDMADTLRPRLQSERDRWLGQVDEITAWLVDHWQRVALGYAGAMGIRDLVVRYIAVARGVWLSDRPLDKRVQTLREITEPVQTIFFARRWRVASHVPGEVARLRAMLDNLGADGPSSPSTSERET
jgi:hypothetical protein